jgi:hypothetical protein
VKRILAAGLGIVLGAAIAAQFVPRPRVVVRERARLDTLPTKGVDWHSRELPVGPTEAVATSAAEVLRYDEVFHREYRSREATFTIYAAFWSPGKMPVQLVASHTPDRCWTEAGWRCTAQAHAVHLTVGADRLRPAESREFVGPDGKMQHVLYWHLVGGALYDYGERFNRVPSPWRWWRDAARQMFRAPPEQYFVRLASDEPFERLRDEPVFQTVVAALAKLGLRE